jgi:hypothetical protein
MKKEASINLKEIEENKRYGILARAIALCMKEMNINCRVDIKAEDDKLKISMEN